MLLLLCRSPLFLVPSLMLWFSTPWCRSEGNGIMGVNLFIIQKLRSAVYVFCPYFYLPVTSSYTYLKYCVVTCRYVV